MLPLHPFDKIAKAVGVKRISKQALEELRDTVEEHAFEKCRRIVDVSIHAQRRTVKKRDVDFVCSLG